MAALTKCLAQEAVGTGIDAWSVRQPLGVVAGITPFNFPLMVPLWMVPVALATGNCFILKPSEKDPSAALKLAALLMFISDVHSLGLQTAQGLVCTETFYWDLNDRTRAFTQRVLPSMPQGLRPGMAQGALCAVIFLSAIVPRGADALTAVSPIGLPWMGMHFRLDDRA